MEQALLSYKEIFGYSPLSGPYSDPIQKVTVCFVGTGIPGDPSFELVVPFGDESPVNRILKQGIGTYHTCYEVDHIEETIAYVRSKGCIVVSNPVPAVAFDGRRIAWFYTPTRQLVEVVERCTKNS
jgi:methylmalonyl-CoA/ethylmalonyl-CoA epimerase